MRDSRSPAGGRAETRTQPPASQHCSASIVSPERPQTGGTHALAGRVRAGRMVGGSLCPHAFNGSILTTGCGVRWAGALCPAAAQTSLLGISASSSVLC